MITDTLVSVLLYLNVISSGGSYTVNDINNFAAVYASQIRSIENNPPLLETVLDEEEPMAIWLIDNLGG